MIFIDESLLDDGDGTLNMLKGGIEDSSDEVVNAVLDPDGKHNTAQLHQWSDSEGYTSRYIWRC